MSRTKAFRSLSQEARRTARQDLKDALAKDFGLLYGTDVNDLRAWQRLYWAQGFEVVPDNLDDCHEFMKDIYVNIVDLVDSVYTSHPVQRFYSEKEFSEYTIRTENYISRDRRYAGSLLKFLCRKISRPSGTTRINPQPFSASNRKRKRT
ncbi:unnamed protein product [Rhizoctonia solani]|uniref:Uncharacterized protein n=1 Tax=Rhizoctonia solani TaxID=456999 RepID=A0A8H3E2N1_9AGAM|nr:unnamed protein product [Rhizoctonia solani]